ncbi:hypothetical protein ACTMTF_42380 [Nonomuraea sp. ZG12]|uniref:hypothetical protein n=1 Tax=Nonomuraea sp. ZG12 TaxID=3452207 RepID=UPI003F8C8C14
MRRGSWHSPRRVLLVKVETEFDRGQAAFTKAEARMRELVAARPQAERIGWSLMLICVRDPDRMTPVSRRLRTIRRRSRLCRTPT